MFLFVFKGPPDRRAEFSALLDRHAAWLHCRKTRHADFFWLGVEGAVEPWFENRPGGASAALFAPPQGDSYSTDTPVVFHSTGDEVRVDVPLATPEQAWYAEDPRGFVAGNDLRPLAAWAGSELDPIGAPALMQFGMVPAPFTLFAKLRRVPNGFSLTRHEGGAVEIRQRVPPLEEWAAPVATDPLEATAERLDGVLESAPRDAVTFFSGGTDSGLIAARLARLGRRDVHLVNYAFGSGDEDSRAAESLAGRLGLPFRRVVHEDAEVGAGFDRIGADALFPFNDLSVIPTHRMLYHARDVLPAGGAALLGVGADDLYDGGLKIRSWDRVYGVPRPVRSMIVTMLGLTRPWWRDDRSRRAWGILRRSLASSHKLGALIMHNDLAGIAYPFDNVQPRIDETWREIYDPFSAGRSREDRLALVYLINGGMGWEAPKFDLLRRFGVRSLYPFLDGAMLRHGLSLDWAQKCAGTKEKVLLKTLLRDSVPGGVERRPKRGFSPPYETLLQRDEIQQRIRAAVLDDKAPLAGIYDADFVRKALDRGRAGSAPNRGLINLIWTAFFASSWIAQWSAALRPDR